MEEAKHLVSKQRKHLPLALRNLRRHSRKRRCDHWIWWAFPTTKKGTSEPSPKTCVTLSTSDYVIENAPPVWRDLLELVVGLLSDVPSSFPVFPSYDVNRIKHFISFWESADHNQEWLHRVCGKLSELL